MVCLLVGFIDGLLLAILLMSLNKVIVSLMVRFWCPSSRTVETVLPYISVVVICVATSCLTHALCSITRLNHWRSASSLVARTTAGHVPGPCVSNSDDRARGRVACLAYHLY